MILNSFSHQPEEAHKCSQSMVTPLRMDISVDAVLWTCQQIEVHVKGEGLAKDPDKADS